MVNLRPLRYGPEASSPDDVHKPLSPLASHADETQRFLLYLPTQHASLAQLCTTHEEHVAVALRLLAHSADFMG
jgi:hypothetical protein